MLVNFWQITSRFPMVLVSFLLTTIMFYIQIILLYGKLKFMSMYDEIAELNRKFFRCIFLQRHQQYSQKKLGKTEENTKFLCGFWSLGI